MTGKALVPLGELRRRARLTQHELAIETGLHSGTVSQLERGLRRPSPKTARRLAKALGVTIDDILGPVETGEPAQTPTRKG